MLVSTLFACVVNHLVSGSFRLAPDVIFASPIDALEKVWTSLRAAGGITDTLRFTHESTAPDRSYLEWELEALGHRFHGVTVLTLDSTGLKIHDHTTLGLVRAADTSALMVKVIGQQAWPEGEVDLLGHLF
jgi:nanoRNase/pAp phosphatase (c-di-AMP/oligoRNAs hydrolase)